MAKKRVGVPREAVAWIRKVFASVNKDVSGLLGVNPNHHEPELDMALIGGLNHAPPVAHPAGWTVYIQTHFLGGRRHFYNWEVADIGFLVIFRDRGKILRIKVGLLQSKRLYPIEEKQVPEHADRFRVGFATLVAEPDAFRTLVSGRSFTFSRESRYLAIGKGDDQARALHQYEKMSSIPVYYLFYNPSTIPLTVTVPAVRLTLPKEPKVGCRVVPARALATAMQSQPDGHHPSFADVGGLASPFRGQHRAGWRLEHFAADLLVSCREGHVANDTTDQASLSTRKGTPRVKRLEAKLGSASSIVIGVHDAAVETDFYNIETDDPRRVHEAEHLIGVFEKAAGYAFANLDRRPSDIPDDIDRENLSLYMALQFVRGHDTGEFQERFYTQTSQMIMRVAANAPDIVRNFLAEQGKDTSDQEIAKTKSVFAKAADAIRVTPHRNETVQAILRGPIDFFPYFFRRKWIIARSKAPFLTSDRPVVLVERPDPNEPRRGVGLGTADLIVFVVDRHRALMMQHPLPEHHEGVVDIEPRQARVINSAVSNHARRWLFHHPDDDPLAGVPFNPRGRTQPAP